MEKANKWNQVDSLSFGVSMLVIFGGGLLICWSTSFDASLLQHALTRDFGIALVIAGVIGSTYELVLHGRLQRRTFTAAAGLFLGDEIKTQIVALSDEKFVCINHVQTVTIRKIDSTLIRMEVEIDRTLKNVSGRTDELIIKSSCFDYGLSVKSPGITRLVAYQGTQQFDDRNDTFDSGRFDAELKTPLRVAKGETVRVLTNFVEIRNWIGVFLEILIAPTQKPEGYVRFEGYDDDVDCWSLVGFGSKYKHGPLGENGRKLEGTLLPFQHLEFRWRVTPRKNL